MLEMVLVMMLVAERRRELGTGVWVSWVKQMSGNLIEFVFSRVRPEAAYPAYRESRNMGAQN